MGWADAGGRETGRTLRRIELSSLPGSARNFVSDIAACCGNYFEPIGFTELKFLGMPCAQSIRSLLN